MNQSSMHRARVAPWGMAAIAAVGVWFTAAGTPAVAQGAANVPFDKPAAVRKVGPKSQADSREATCTYFADLMIRDLTDGPTAVDPVLVRGTGMPCTVAAYPGGRSIKLSDMGFEGRKGGYLFFRAMDGNGASGFSIVEVETARVLLKDSVASVGATGNRAYTAMSVGADGALTLRYNRGIEAGCSLYKNPAKCWASLAGRGLIAKDMAATVPKAEICAASYRRDKSPKDNNSIVTYSAEIVLSKDGKVQTLSRGAIGCEPQP